MDALPSVHLNALEVRSDSLSHTVPVMQWAGASGDLSGLHIIHCPAFAEEMNKSRHLVAAASREFSAAGATVWVPDLLGTGDSIANLTDATWSVWVNEITACVQAAKSQQAQSILLWGNRLGALLATEAAQALEDSRIALLLWQPVVSGEAFVRQFLRLLSVKASTGEGTSQPALDTVDAGRESEMMEVAGYRIPSDLIDSIRALGLSPLAELKLRAVSIFEVSPVSGKSVSPKLQRWLDATDQALPLEADVCSGDVYWASQELGHAPELLTRSLRAVTEMNASDSLPVPGHDFPAEPAGNYLVEQSSTTFVFRKDEEQLVGHIRRGQSAAHAAVGVIIVVGGPQYRVGSHRLFVKMAESLATDGYPSMCFDHQGMGDSSGVHQGFENISSDLRAAIDAFQTRCPDVRSVVLWGLCDGATASALYAADDPRVSGLILANPWVYSEDSKAEALIETHYKSRLTSFDFWRRVVSGKVNLVAAVGGFFSVLAKRLGSGGGANGSSAGSRQSPQLSLADRTLTSLAMIDANLAVLLSEHDITAAEFDVALRRFLSSRRDGPQLQNKIRIERLSRTDHTFSSAASTKHVADSTKGLLRTWFD